MSDNPTELHSEKTIDFQSFIEQASKGLVVEDASQIVPAIEEKYGLKVKLSRRARRQMKRLARKQGKSTVWNIMDLRKRSKKELQFGIDIISVLLEEAKKHRKYKVTVEGKGGVRTQKTLLSPIVNYNVLYEMFVIINNELHDAKTGRANNPDRCVHCAEFSEHEYTVFNKLSGSCVSGSDVPLATDPACEHFKPMEDL